MKLDIEPHSIPGWGTDRMAREKLNTTYIGLITDAKTSINGLMPLWVDCPVRYFTQEKTENWHKIFPKLPMGSPQ